MQCTRLYLFILMLHCSPLFLFGQKIKTINATKQNWSGGIAGRHGTYYSFVIAFSDLKDEPAPDTLWTEQEYFEISLRDEAKQVQGNTKRSRTKGSVKFEINVSTAHDEPDNNLPRQNENKHHVHAPVPYNGAALLSYRYKGKEHYYEIKKIMKALPAANYP